jgi:hypothetical protein
MPRKPQHELSHEGAVVHGERCDWQPAGAGAEVVLAMLGGSMRPCDRVTRSAG